MASNGTDKEPAPAFQIQKKRNLARRTLSGLLMVSAFIALLYIGHSAIFALTCALQLVICYEVHVIMRNNLPPGSCWPLLDLFYLLCTMYVVHGGVLFQLYPLDFSENALLHFLQTRHLLVSALLYFTVFITFTFSCMYGNILSRFQQAGWLAVILLQICLPVALPVYLLFNAGLFWYLFPVALVIWNDVCAYLVGLVCGRHPLIELSPNKTWEGFIGSAVLTFLFAFYVSPIFAPYELFVCPKVNFWEHPVCASTPYLFTPQTLELPAPTPLSVEVLPIQVHALALAAIAAFLAPFNGFLASGFKRSVNIKDFGALIPGHGGATDRFDCKLLMTCATFVYYYAVVPYFACVPPPSAGVGEAAAGLLSPLRMLLHLPATSLDPAAAVVLDRVLALPPQQALLLARSMHAALPA